MTEPDNSSSSTRPISVAELLAKNGTIGAPPVGGRRRRRRGNADAVTVAELTGEIPIITDRSDTREEPARVDHGVDQGDETTRIPVNGAAQDTVTEPAAEVADEPVDSTETAAPETPEPEVADSDEGVAPDAVDSEAVDFEVVESEVVESGAEEAPETAEAPVERDTAVGAEEMSPDSLLDDDEEPADLLDEDLDEPALLDREDDDELPSYLRSSAGPLFGGGTVADDLARRGAGSGTGTGTLDEHDEDDDALDALDVLDERDHDDDVYDDGEPADRMSAFLRGAWIVGQCIIAVALGAGLFIAFDQLWKWNNIVALVLSVLVILGLVVGVRVVRKTEDIGSTLIAVAVGALVTLGPLALLQSG
jgi:hypothetical protein